MVAKELSTHDSKYSTQVSVPVEDGSQQSASFTHALKRSTLSCPLMPLADQYLRTHFNVLQLSTNNQNNLINNKRRHPQALIVLPKPQTTK
jgi:hypothetical protein